MIYLSSPDITKLEIERVNTALSSRTLSGGLHKKEFEEKLAATAGTKYAVAVSSGTAALHLIMLALGIGAGDEVITTPFSFVASANCILYVGAKPVFCDIALPDLNLDPYELESKITARTKAILVVHIFGRPADMDMIRKIASKHGLPVVEDACEAIGAKFNGQPVGGLGTAGTFAFYPNKQITTGEGGAIVTNHRKIADYARSLANQGREDSGQWLQHIYLGYNYRLNELSAALGSAQLDRLPDILDQRAQVADWYYQELKDQPRIITPNESQADNQSYSWFVYVVRFRNKQFRDEISKRLAERGIETRPYFPAIHLQPLYRERFAYTEGAFPVAEAVAASSLALPFHTKISRKEVQEVCEHLKNALVQEERRLL